MAKVALDFLGREAANGGELLVAILQGDKKTEAELGGRYKEAWGMAGEVLTHCFQQVRGMEPRRQQVILGRVLFEVLASFNPANRIGFANKLGKADFLTNLTKRSIIKNKAVAGLADKAEDVRESLRKLHAGKWCFLAGTMIATAHGSVPIEDIQPGDLVTARHETTLEQSAKPVVQLFQNWATLVYLVAVDADLDGDADETFRVTGEHPFYVLGTGFVPAKLLSSGAVLSTAEFEVARVTSVSRERAPPGSRFRTYNFEVADYHTYFVGESEVWVHNLCLEALEGFDGLFEALRKDGRGLEQAIQETIEIAREQAQLNTEEIAHVGSYLLSKHGKDLPPATARQKWREFVQRHADQAYPNDPRNPGNGKAFNDLRRPYYVSRGGANEVEIDIGRTINDPILGKRGPNLIVDSYIPGEEIVERKWTQLAEIDEGTVLTSLDQLGVLYDPAIGKLTARNKDWFDAGVLDPGDVGRALRGQLYLEVPIQNGAVPAGILERATQLNIIIRDVTGFEYN